MIVPKTTRNRRAKCRCKRMEEMRRTDWKNRGGSRCRHGEAVGKTWIENALMSCEIETGFRRLWRVMEEIKSYGKLWKVMEEYDIIVPKRIESYFERGTGNDKA